MYGIGFKIIIIIINRLIDSFDVYGILRDRIVGMVFMVCLLLYLVMRRNMMSMRFSYN